MKIKTKKLILQIAEVIMLLIMLLLGTTMIANPYEVPKIIYTILGIGYIVGTGKAVYDIIDKNKQ